MGKAWLVISYRLQCKHFPRWASLHHDAVVLVCSPVEKTKRSVNRISLYQLILQTTFCNAMWNREVNNCHIWRLWITNQMNSVKQIGTCKRFTVCTIAILIIIVTPFNVTIILIIITTSARFIASSLSHAQTQCNSRHMQRCSEWDLWAGYLWLWLHYTAMERRYMSPLPGRATCSLLEPV